MDQRDVTRWVSSLAVSQEPDCYYRTFALTFRGWHSVDPAARWDIYGSRDEATPRETVLIRAGIVPPDRQPIVTVDKKGLSVAVTGYDWAWMAQRRAPTSTVVLAPTRSAARRAIEAYNAFVGRWQWVEAATLHDAVTRLGALAGFWAELRIPNYSLTSYVMDPQKSYWEGIANLLEPLAPRIYFRRTESRVLIADRAAQWIGIGSVLKLSENQITSVEAGPSFFKYVRRVLLRRI